MIPAYSRGMLFSTKEKYQRMRPLLNEKQWRQYLATEAEERKNIALVAREAYVAVNTIVRGQKEIARTVAHLPPATSK